MEQNNNKNLLLVLLLIALGIVGFAYYKKNSGQVNSAQTNEQGIILYTEIGCPHCLNVENFIKENKTREKIQFTEKEISNQVNLKSFLDKASKCGIKSDKIGVPLLWTGEKCLVGDQDIINFFKEKTNGE